MSPAKESWKDVVYSYCFSRTPLAEFTLFQIFEGLHTHFRAEITIRSAARVNDRPCKNRVAL